MSAEHCRFPPAARSRHVKRRPSASARACLTVRHEPVRSCDREVGAAHELRRTRSRMSVLKRLFAVRSVDSIVRQLEAAPPLKRVLTARSLIAIGLGSTIGTGIFILTGTVAANHTGPALTLALLIAAIGSTFAAICYAEFA